MILEMWLGIGAACVAAVVGSIVIWLRMPLFRWSCRRCKKVVSISRFHPKRCACGEDTLVANFCKRCGSWNTTPTPHRHCAACSSKELCLAAEYHFHNSRWRMRNPNPLRSYF